jgi:hypothetical protein
VTRPPAAVYEVRRANADDAQAIGAVFDAAVRAGWTYLGELGEKPMFAPEDWHRLVADHAPPNVLLVATDPAGRDRFANRTSTAPRYASCASSRSS